MRKAFKRMERILRKIILVLIRKPMLIIRRTSLPSWKIKKKRRSKNKRKSKTFKMKLKIKVNPL